MGPFVYHRKRTYKRWWMMVDKDQVLARYRISQEQFAQSKLDWAELVMIYDDFVSSQPQFLAAANFLHERLRNLPGVHSVKLRLKDPEHLLEKIIRKRIIDPEREFSLNNFKTAVTDLIGLRALHLFKDEWHPIHNSITETWELYEPPVANVRRGDHEKLIEQFQSAGCEIKEHEFGYRSIHYLVRFQPTKQEYVAEIQVRTIFEEGWSEIDHQIRYPYEIDNSILAQFLVMFNRLAGSADEMGSFVKLLKRDLRDRESKAADELAEKNELIENLERQIAGLKVAEKEKAELRSSLNQIQRSIVSPVTLSLSGSALQSVMASTPIESILSSIAHSSVLSHSARVAELGVLRSSVAAAEDVPGPADK
jgi:putative GTP pyrophosphokinase